MKKVIIIGCGAMGGAILSGCLAHDIWKKEEVSVREHSEEASERMKKLQKLIEYGNNYTEYKPIHDELKKLPHHPKKVISIAAAVALETLEKGLPDAEIVRVMPNTPASVGEGMTAIAPGKKASDELVKTTEEIFTALGKAAVVTERQLDELGALSGAGPGYAFVIIDALADAGVLVGLPRKLAIEAAAQTLYGAAKMVLETGKHPAELRDQVTSPGGTTIAGIYAMEKRGIRAALIDGVKACLDKTNKK